MNNEQTKSSPLKITVHYASCCQNPKNCHYPILGAASDAEAFAKIVSRDHVFFDFQDNYRNLHNFLGTDVAAVDCDNDHSENPDDWITLRQITGIFSNVPFVAYTSRNHMKPKGKKAARPRFHLVFPITRITSAEAYTELLTRLQAYLPVFDENAMDAGRFYFGNPGSKVYFHEGDLPLDAFLEEAALWGDNGGSVQAALESATPDENSARQRGITENIKGDTSPIPEGSRNATLSAIAGKLIKRYGDTQQAREEFLQNAARCQPPLPDKELTAIWKSAQKFYEKVRSEQGYLPPEEYERTRVSRNFEEAAAPFKRESLKWEQPVPFDEPNLPPFPLDSLPRSVRGYVVGLSESTQTPTDICGAAVLAILALCAQGKYRIMGKPDWIEPLNLYVVGVAEPSERKSAIISAVTRPLCDYEAQENTRLKPLIEKSRMEKRILEQKQKALEAKAAKGKASPDELLEVADEIASFQIKKPLRLYVDDITTEKLTSALADYGSTAILSSEGGIFDLLAGIYSKNVNIDVILKAWSGDSIRVDRVGRECESVHNPALTVLLTVQPSVINGMMANRSFTGRGLTARFLYCMPKSRVGNRRFFSEPIPQDAKDSYARIVTDMLEDHKPEPELIRLSNDARELLGDFAATVEEKLRTDYADIAQWAGKLVGTVLRIAGILCRAGQLRADDFPDEPEPLIVDADTMQKAINLGGYFTEHAKAAYALMGADETTANAKYLLEMITKHRLERFTRRQIMRLCRRFKGAAQLRPALTQLEDCGYIAVEQEQVVCGKQSVIYSVNPVLYETPADNSDIPA